MPAPANFAQMGNLGIRPMANFGPAIDTASEGPDSPNATPDPPLTRLLVRVGAIFRPNASPTQQHRIGMLILVAAALYLWKKGK